MAYSDPDWLGDLRWRGYPHLEPARDRAAAVPAGASTDVRPRDSRETEPEMDSRLVELARENETLRSRLESLSKLAAEFERKLADAGTSYETAVLEAESKLRDAALERERLTGELTSAREELSRSAARDAGHEADLRLERERRSDSERALAETRRKHEERSDEAERLRALTAEQSGQIGELRLQVAAQNERLLKMKALADEDMRLLRRELRELLVRMQPLPEEPGANAGESA